MADINELRASLPIDQIAARLGEDPDSVRRAVDLALPALVGGLQANVADPGGEASLLQALAQHDGALASGTIDIDQVDEADGAKITHHIFGAQEEQVVNQLGSTGASSGLLKKLIPILAPIVLSYLAKQVGARGGPAAGGGVLGTILSTILAGAAQGAGGSQASNQGLGGVLGDLLGGLLGGGRKG